MRRRPSRLRRRVRALPWIHSPPLYWVGATAVIAVTAIVVWTVTSGATRDRDRYGEPVEVLVAAHELAAGTRIGEDDLTTVELPSGMLPADAVEANPTGRVVTSAIFEGEVIAGGRLAPEGLSPTAALLPEGSRAVAIPLLDNGLPVEVGDRVDVLATVDPALSGEQLPTGEVATGATVVAVEEDSVTVAVEPEETVGVAFALVNGFVTVALTRG
ncbi:MAG: hypothetical protein JJLCMIEE_02154 [Acidimicrobiales bacterium]|nr:MAG: hypothetical protein EDR02_13205 [Actinomycetota bacterium]MBV6509087.1 hypothetical protein [Acidimicrobiales bacterium]RIK03717.1 MAG: hypothetical protein DCC48_15855 [Acidobacteriota bacterium]